MKRLIIFAALIAGLSGVTRAQVAQGGYVATSSATTSILGQAQITMVGTTCNVVTPGSACTVSGLAISPLAAYQQTYYLTGTPSTSESLVIPLQPGAMHIIFNSTGQNVSVSGPTGASVLVPSSTIPVTVFSPDGANYYQSAVGSVTPAVLQALLAASPFSMTGTNCTPFGDPGNSLAIGDSANSGQIHCQPNWSIDPSTGTLQGANGGGTNITIDTSGNIDTAGTAQAGTLSSLNTGGTNSFAGGIITAGVTGGNKGAGSINVGSCFVNGVACSTGTISNALTMNNSDSGATSGTTFDGSVARTISTNTIGAPNLAVNNNFTSPNQSITASDPNLLLSNASGSQNFYIGTYGPGCLGQFSFNRVVDTGAIPNASLPTAYINVGGCSGLGSEIDLAVTATNGVVPTQVVNITPTAATFSIPVAMGANKITGLANGTASSDAAAFGQIPLIPVSGTLNAAIAACGSSPTTLLINTGITLSASVSVPANCSLLFQFGGELLPSSGQVITCAAPGCNILASTSQQIFGGAGTVVGLADSYPEWFGAVVYGGGTDDSSFINAALTATAGGTVHLAAQNYGISSTLNISTSGTKLIGTSALAGGGGTIVQLNSATGANVFVNNSGGTVISPVIKNINFTRSILPSGTTAIGISSINTGGEIVDTVTVIDSTILFFNNQTPSFGTGYFANINAGWSTTVGGSPYTSGNLYCIDLDSTNGIGEESLLISNVNCGQPTTFAATTYGRWIHGSQTSDVFMKDTRMAFIHYPTYIDNSGILADDIILQNNVDDVSSNSEYVNGISGSGDVGVAFLGGLFHGASGAPTFLINNSSNVSITGGAQLRNTANEPFISFTGTVSSCVVSGNTFDNGTGTTNGITGTVNGCAFTGNTFAGNMTTGINLTSSTNTSITGNTFLETGTNGIVVDTASSHNFIVANAIGASVTNKVVDTNLSDLTLNGNEFNAFNSNSFTGIRLAPNDGGFPKLITSAGTAGVGMFNNVIPGSPLTYGFNGSAGGFNFGQPATGIQSVNFSFCPAGTAGASLAAYGTTCIGLWMQNAANSAGSTLQAWFNTQAASPTWTTSFLGNAKTICANPTCTFYVDNTGAMATTSIAINGGTAITAQSGTGGTVAMITSPVFSGLPQAPTAAPLTNTTQISTTGYVDAAIKVASGTSNAITTATGGSGTGTVTCLTLTCTNLRGTYSVAGGTFTTGNFLALVWPATTTAYICTATMNGGTGFLGIGNDVATATGVNISAGLSILGVTVTVNYECKP